MATTTSTLLLLSCFILYAGITVDGAAVYTRWGRKTCARPETELVYTGYVGGSNTDFSGGSANYVCLPDDPSYGNGDGVLNERGRMIGGEYAFGPNNFPFDPTDPELTGETALCSVCLAPYASVVLMIPARTTCYQGWTMEYTGYLVTQKYDTTRTEYVCVDRSPETNQTIANGNKAALMYPVDGNCFPGSLPCPPYEDGWELACVVCVK